LDRLRHRRQSPFELSASPDEPRPPKPSHPSQKQSPTTKTLLDATQSLLENERLWTGTSLCHSCSKERVALTTEVARPDLLTLAGGWSNNWLWSLPLIVLTVLAHGPHRNPRTCRRTADEPLGSRPVPGLARPGR